MNELEKLINEVREGGIIDWLHLGNIRKTIKTTSAALTLIILLIFMTIDITCTDQYLKDGILFALIVSTISICFAELWIGWEFTVFNRKTIELRLTVVLILLSYIVGFLIIFFTLIKLISSCQLNL